MRNQSERNEDFIDDTCGAISSATNSDVDDKSEEFVCTPCGSNGFRVIEEDDEAEKVRSRIEGIKADIKKGKYECLGIGKKTRVIPQKISEDRLPKEVNRIGRMPKRDQSNERQINGIADQPQWKGFPLL